MEEEPAEGGGVFVSRFLRALEAEEEIVEEEFITKIKQRCFICLESIENSFHYYLKFGNCCQPCNSRINLRLKRHGRIQG